MAPAAQGDRGEPSREEELAEVRQRIRELESRAERLGSERRSLVTDLVRLEVDLDLRRARMAEARLAHREAVARIQELAAEVGKLEALLAQRRERLEKRIVHLYRVDRQGGLRLLLSERQRHEVQPGLRVLRYQARTDARAVEAFLEDRRDLAARKEELRLQELEADLWVRAEREGVQELDRLRAEKTRLVRDLEAREERARLEARELEEREARLERFLDALLGSAELDGDPIQEFQGMLDGPAIGSVVQGFGPRTDPRYRTRVPHNGIDLVTLPGAEVRAVYPGTVLYAAELEGYGLTAILLHPHRVFTLYAGLDRLEVEVDDVVSLGRSLGSSRGRFYFEIRVENRPVDPETWLR